MSEHTESDGSPQPGRADGRRVDLTSFILALVLLGVAMIGVSGETWWLIPHLMPWLIAGAVALVGLGLIVSTLPRGGRRND